MIKTSIEKMADDIGFDIGQSNDETQGKLLNGFCRALHNSMSECDRKMQISYMVQHLEHNAMKILLEISEFVELSEKWGKK